MVGITKEDYDWRPFSDICGSHVLKVSLYVKPTQLLHVTVLQGLAQPLQGVIAVHDYTYNAARDALPGYEQAEITFITLWCCTDKSGAAWRTYKEPNQHFAEIYGAHPDVTFEKAAS